MTENKRFKNVEEKLDWGTIQYFTYNDKKLTDDEIEDLVNLLLEENKDLEEARSYYQENFLTMKTERNQLKQENKELQERNNRQCRQLDNLYTLIEKQDWITLKGLIQEFQECEEQLQKEWSGYP